MSTMFRKLGFLIIKVGFRRCSTHQEVSYVKPVIFDNINTFQKILKVAIIGLPNAGKSTLINNLMDRKVCPTSSKIHTTRKKAEAIFIQGDSQIVFLDTPGLVTPVELKKYNLEKTFLRDSSSSTHEADTIGVIHDVSDLWCRERLDLKILKLLEKYNKKPSFLVLNKIDVLKSKRKLLDITRLITMNCLDGKPFSKGKDIQIPAENLGWPHFKDVFMVSSLTGDGLSRIKDYLTTCAKPGSWLYPADTYSNQTPEKIIVDTVKATFLDFLPQEIPYQLNPVLELYEIDEENVISAVVTVLCPTERIAKLIAGSTNGRLRQITEKTQTDLQSVFQNYVRIRLVLQSAEKSKKS